MILEIMGLSGISCENKVRERSDLVRARTKSERVLRKISSTHKFLKINASDLLRGKVVKLKFSRSIER